MHENICSYLLCYMHAYIQCSHIKQLYTLGCEIKVLYTHFCVCFPLFIPVSLSGLQSFIIFYYAYKGKGLLLWVYIWCYLYVAYLIAYDINIIVLFSITICAATHTDACIILRARMHTHTCIKVQSSKFTSHHTYILTVCILI